MPGPPDNLQSAIDRHVKKLTQSRNVNPISLPHDDRNPNKYDSNMMKIALKLLRDWQEDIWLMRKETQVHKITNLDSPSVIAPDQSLEQLVLGMHQGYCRDRCIALVKAWGREFALDGQESESLIKVIQDSNEKWVDELKMRPTPKGSHKRKVMSQELDNEGKPGKGEVMSASILGQPWRVGKRQVKLTTKATNANQE